MGALDWASERLFTWVVLLLVFGSILAVSILGVAGWAVLLLLGGETGTLGTMLPLFVLAAFATLPLTALAGVLALVGFAARASSAVSGDRAKQVASYVERESDLARMVGLSNVVENVDSRSPEQRADDRIERLKDEYVDGKLSDSEFERRMQTILNQEGVTRERSSVIDEQLREGRRERER